MEENMKSIILIGNSTFTFTEDSHNVGTDRNCQEAKSKYHGDGPQKQNSAPFNTITITSVGGEQANQQVYDQYGYYSNLTVYLNDPSVLNNGPKTDNQWNGGFSLPENAASDGIENYPFFNSENPVDFPFISTDTIAPGDDMQYMNIRNDSPEFIDINSLVIPSEYQGCFMHDPNKTVPPFLKRNRKGKTRDDESGEDDDVIFVKEYKNGEQPLQEPEKPMKVFPEPRRNPKRQVQLQKVSYELASKLSFDELYDCKKYNKKEHYVANGRRSTRTTGAVFSPPNRLNSYDYKEWPVDGMHEKPTFNPVTKKLVKLPNTTKRKPGPRPGGLYNRKKAPNAKKKVSQVKEDQANTEFAKTTHSTFHHILSYIQSLKEYNKLTSNTDQANLESAKNVLLDSCVLYSLANDVSEVSLAKYLNSISAKEDIPEFLKSFVDNIDDSKKENVCSTN